MQSRRWAAGLAVTAVGGGCARRRHGGGRHRAPDARRPTTPTRRSARSASPPSSPASTRSPHRINGDASVKGSTAWLRAKADKARAAGYPALADLLTARADDRPGRLDELTKLRSDVQHVQATDCAG